jgi:hypothetical protein
MDLSALHREALAMRREILEELDAEYAIRNAETARHLRAAAAAANAAETELRAAEEARKEKLRRKRKNKANAKRTARAQTQRKRRPGANFEIAGRPAHLNKGAPMRNVEGTQTFNRTLALTRGKRSKATYKGGNQ